MPAGAPYDRYDVDLAKHLQITVAEVNGRFYLYVFADFYVVAIEAIQPKGEKYLRVDGVWHHGERAEF